MIAATLCSFKVAAADLPKPAADALRKASIPQSAVGAWVQELGAPSPTLAINARSAMNPGSTMKIVTTLAALELLGPAYTWKTEVYLDGPNLVLRGHGDPKLTVESFWMLLRNLRGRGLRDLRGDVILDRTYFAPAQYEPIDDDVFRSYNVTPDALLVNFKSLRFTFLPEEQGVRLYVEPTMPGLVVTNTLKLGPGACPDGNRPLREVTQAAFQSVPPSASFTGTYPVSCGERELNLAIHDPQDYFAAILRGLWTELGGTWTGGVRDGVVPPTAKLLYVHESEPLSDLIRDINKFSNNVMARQVFLTIGAEKGGAPARTEEAVRAIKDWIASKRISAPELTLENGSGLSRSERISVEHMAALLQAAWRSPMMPEFISSLPVAAVDGTMKKRLHGERVAGSAHIKTGLLNDSRAIAGYVLDRHGRRWVVVMFVNHGRARDADAAQDALLEWIYEGPTAPTRPITNRPVSSRPRP